MKKKMVLALALSASVASFGALAQDINSGPPAGAGTGDMGAAGAGAAGMGASQPFEKLDTDKDGSISKQEAKRNNINKQFSQIDTDKDGRISQSEYQTWVQTGTGAGGAGGTQAPSGGAAQEGAGDTGDAVGPTQAPRGVDPGVPGAPPAGSPTTPGGTSGP